MSLFEPLEELECRENSLRNKVNQLSSEQKRRYYQAQMKQLKDPDTYASLNWFCLGGFHHLYLEKKMLFFIEIKLFLIAITALYIGHIEALFILVVLVLYELPHLFFSQKIVRQYNQKISNDIFQEITGAIIK
ncbi:hypothetical protein DZ860_11535 [Vibrio sinensis]|uniref:TM2 domain-containing protein n=1 Tax=Vibrio sinensis TaxID=2302434 RepID=A0A3A6QQC1_9VIBR|nr:hypothetical protein [Vibrio sinensis]RJX70959.1 hypothetical protein DZ860_11535 [Vibrio sinensis]